MSGLVAWYDASQITGKADSDAVSSWADSSGNGHTASQATGSKQPLYKTNILNGFPVLRFDGIDDFMSVSSMGALTNHSVFVVAKDSAEDWGVLGGPTGNPQIRRGYFGNDKLSFKDSVSDNTAPSTTLHVAQGNWSLMEWVFVGTTCFYYQNGVAHGTGAYSGTMPAEAYGTLGGLFTGSGTLTGDFAEIFYGSDTSCRVTAERYVQRKYALF